MLYAREETPFESSKSLPTPMAYGIILSTKGAEMETTLVVDGYNAINAIALTKKYLANGKLETARKTILAIVKEYARSSGYITKVKVVFDGDDQYKYLERMDITRGDDHHFSATGDCDDQLIDTVRRYSKLGRVVLASNDNYVRNNSRSFGASIINVEDLTITKKIKKRKKRKVQLRKYHQE